MSPCWFNVAFGRIGVLKLSKKIIGAGVTDSTDLERTIPGHVYHTADVKYEQIYSLMATKIKQWNKKMENL